jgi:hypothetical protein
LPSQKSKLVIEKVWKKKIPAGPLISGTVPFSILSIGQAGGSSRRFLSSGWPRGVALGIALVPSVGIKLSESDRPPCLDTVRRTLLASPPGLNAVDRRSKSSFFSTARSPRSDDKPPSPHELLLCLHSPRAGKCLHRSKLLADLCHTGALRGCCLPACRTGAPLPRRASRRLPPPAPPDPLLDAKLPSAFASPAKATLSCPRSHRASRWVAAVASKLSAGHPRSHRSWSTTGPRSYLSSPSAASTRPRHRPRRGCRLHRCCADWPRWLPRWSSPGPTAPSPATLILAASAPHRPQNGEKPVPFSHPHHRRSTGRR